MQPLPHKLPALRALLVALLAAALSGVASAVGSSQLRAHRLRGDEPQADASVPTVESPADVDHLLGQLESRYQSIERSFDSSSEVAPLAAADGADAGGNPYGVSNGDLDDLIKKYGGSKSSSSSSKGGGGGGNDGMGDLLDKYMRRRRTKAPAPSPSSSNKAPSPTSKDGKKEAPKQGQLKIAAVPSANQGVPTLRLEARTRTVKHATARKMFAAVCQTASACLTQHTLKHIIRGKAKTWEWPEPDWSPTRKRLSFLRLKAPDDDAWFPDYVEASIVSGNGQVVTSERFELDGWMEGSPKEGGRSDKAGPGHPMFHKSELIIARGPRVTVTVKTSGHQVSQNMGNVRLYPCESQDKCMESYVKLRDLTPGRARTYSASMWQDLQKGGAYMPLKAFGGVRLVVADPECDEHTDFDACQSKHKSDCWYGAELEVTVEGLKGAEKATVPTHGLLCRNPSEMPAMVNLKGKPKFVVATRTYLPAGSRVTVNVTTAPDSSTGGAATIKLCTTKTSCRGKLKLEGLQPGTNQSFDFIVEELTKTDAIDFKLEGIFVSWEGKTSKWHPLQISVQIEDKKPKTYLTDGYFVGDTKWPAPPCVNYWATTRYIRGGSPVRFVVDTAFDEAVSDDAVGPICATLCQTPTNCLPSKVLLGGGDSPLVPGTTTSHIGVIEELVPGDSTAAALKFKQVKLTAGSKESKPWHFTEVKAELLALVPGVQWGLPMSFVADHWVTPEGLAKPQPCFNNWGTGSMVIGDDFERLEVTVSSQEDSMAVEGPICLGLCTDSFGSACAAEKVAVSDLRPSSATKVRGVVKKGTKAPKSLSLLGAASGGAWYAESVDFNAPFQKKFDTNGWLLPKEGSNSVDVQKAIAGSCSNWMAKDYSIVDTNTYVTAEVLTMSDPGDAGSEGPFCLHLCKSKGNCLKSAVSLEQLTPGQWLTFTGIVDDQSALSSLPEIGGVQIVAKSQKEWFCDTVRVGVKKGRSMPDSLVDFAVRRWLMNPLDTKEYPVSPSGSQVYFAGKRGAVKVTAWTRDDVGTHAGTKGSVEVYPCMTRDDCLDYPVVMTSLLEGKEQTFAADAEVPDGFKLRGVRISSSASDAWFGKRLVVELGGQKLDVQLNGWVVADPTSRSEPDPLVGDPSWVVSTIFVAPDIAATAQVYSFSGCDGPIEVQPCASATDCESPVTVKGPWKAGDTISGSSKLTTLVSASGFDIEFVNITNRGPTPCGFGTAKFSVTGGKNGLFGPTGDAGSLVPTCGLSAPQEASTVKSGESMQFRLMDPVTFTIKTENKPHAGARGPIAVAMCNKDGSACMSTVTFLSGLKQGQEQTVKAALPMSYMRERHADFRPEAVYISSMESDAWMMAKMTVSGAGIDKAVEVFGKGWLAGSPPSTGDFPGNFWNSHRLLPAGGVIARVETQSLGNGASSIAASKGAVDLAICSRPGLCAGTVRMSGLSSGSTNSFEAGIGELPPDFTDVAFVQLNSSSSDTWCIRWVKVTLVPVKGSSLPATVKGSQKTFLANGCLTTDTQPANRQYVSSKIDVPMMFFGSGAVLRPGGPTVKIATSTYAGTFSGSTGPIMVELCPGRSRCIDPLPITNLKPGQTQSFSFQLPVMADLDFKPIGIKVTAGTDDSWYAKRMLVEFEGQKPQDFILDGWFEEHPDPARHLGESGSFIESAKFFMAGPSVEIKTTTGSQPMAGSDGPFEVVICQNPRACLDNSPIVLTGLKAGETQTFLGNVPELMNFPDFEVSGLKVLARTKDSWAPKFLEGKILSTGAKLGLNLNGWLDEAPVELTNYPKRSDGLEPFFATADIYLDTCTMLSCQRNCQLKFKFEGGHRKQSGECKCLKGEILNDDKRTCSDQSRFPPPPNLQR